MSSSSICGSDEAVLRNISSLLLIVNPTSEFVTCPRMSSTQTSPWKMNKPVLTATLTALGVPVRPEWTVPELRSLLSEQRDAEKTTSSELKGLSGMKLDQLIQKCKDLNIQLPPKPTRGLLTRMIRDRVPATPTELALSDQNWYGLPCPAHCGASRTTPEKS